jgi:hypothetical protein
MRTYTLDHFVAARQRRASITAVAITELHPHLYSRRVDVHDEQLLLVLQSCMVLQLLRFASPAQRLDRAYVLRFHCDSDYQSTTL